MISRCYSEKSLLTNPTYLGCTVCEDWRYLSNFIKWVDSQPNRDWQNCHLDKDILMGGNRVYSPSTVVYVSAKINTFMIDCGKTRGKLMIGVSLNNKKLNRFTAKCSNPFTNKREHLGNFYTELEAHKAWQAKKHEHACRFADMQEDPRVAQRLRELYSDNVDLTIK